MHFHIVTLFKGIIEGYGEDSILKRAREAGLISIEYYNPRDFSTERHHKVDDRPYGGGPGMVMAVQPIIDCVTHIQKRIQERGGKKTKICICSPGGEIFTNTLAKKYSKAYSDIIIISGRYEGIDARVQKILRATPISIGDYVLTGGELPAMILVDCISRQIKGVLGTFESLEEERVSSHEMYTRPAVYEHNGKKYKVPKVLQEGNHKLIDEWRKGEST